MISGTEQSGYCLESNRLVIFFCGSTRLPPRIDIINFHGGSVMTEQVNADKQPTQSPQPKKSGFSAWLDRVFKLSENGTTVRTEIFAGLTTFFAMCYIVIVNPNQITGFNSSLTGIWNAVYVGGLISAIIGTLLMAFLAKKPFAQASGMGLNSFFNVVFIGAATGGDALQRYGAGLAVILISGIIFLILSFTGLRKYIATALPDCLKKAIPAGIGLFIALLGFKNSYIIQANKYTFVQLADCTKWLTKSEFGEINGGAAPVLAAFLGFMAIAVFANQNKVKFLRKASVILGIIFSSVLYYLFTWTTPSWNGLNIGQTFSDFGKYGFSAFNGESWAMLFDGHTIGNIFTVIMLVVTFCLVDMFDTLGTLYGTCSQANMLDKNGDPQNLAQCLMCDSIGTVVGACLGTSTVTTFVESASGVAEGGRTGLTSIVTALGFILCLFLSPLASIVPSVATAPALIYVGVLMLKSFANVDMTDLRSAVPAFLALIMMPLTYSISNGIGVGAIAYVIITVCTGKYTKKDIVITIIAALFLARFALVAM